MNKGFAPLFFHVANMDLVGKLIEDELATQGNLAQLAFCAEYPSNEEPGSGYVSVYRRSEDGRRSLVSVGLDNMKGKLWFTENEAWRVERHCGNPTGVSQFYAEIARHPAYREDIRIDLKRPLLRVRVIDLPVLAQYAQSRPRMEQLPLLRAA